MDDTILRIKDLRVHYESESEVVEAVNGVSFDLKRGKTLGLVGETGAGKTTIAMSILRLVQSPGRILEGSILFNDLELTSLNEKQMRGIRSKSIAMIFQDPMTALNPVLTVGEQVAEVFRTHEKLSRQEAMKKAMDMFELVGIPGTRYNEYPHQFSGGMKQRVVIAEALACKPELLIADEPTTALDVTIQAQVLDMIRHLQKKLNTSMILITHDMGVIAETCDEVAVIYAGNIVEYGSLDQVFTNAQHPYTKGLFASLPSLDKDIERLKPIDGLMPDPANLPPYCSFCERCPVACEKCKNGEPDYIEIEPGHMVRCKLFG
jgi:peptide/nickel transport system ATP-binding protein